MDSSDSLETLSEAKPSLSDQVRVVIVISGLGRGGAERQVVEIANGLNSRNCEVHIVSLSSHNPLGPGLSDEDLYFHVIERRWRGDISVILRLAKFIRAKRPDIVHAFLFDAEIICRLSKLFCQKFVLVGSERNSDYTQKWYQFFLRKVTVKLMDYCVANSESGAAYNQSLYSVPKEKYRVVHNGVDTAYFRPWQINNERKILGIDTGEFCIGMFASFKRQKNHIALVNAVVEVSRYNPNIRLLFVGGVLHQNYGGSRSYEKDVADAVRAAGIGDKVIFLGHQDNLVGLYNICDVFVLPSLHEGLPNVVLEAQSCGVPCIVSDVSDNRYLVSHGQTGFVYAAEDGRALVEHLLYLIENEEMRLKMGRAAREHVFAKFSLDEMVRNMESCYTEFSE